MSYPTLEHVAMEARPYPAHLLEGCETGLCLFSAAFMGHNDAIWFAQAGIKTTCVDRDWKRSDQMQALYPGDWEWCYDDAWEFAENARATGRTWDAVSVDPFTGDAMNRSNESIDLWWSLTNRVLVVGTKMFPFVVPAAWGVAQSGYVERATDIYWLVLTRD